MPERARFSGKPVLEAKGNVHALCAVQDGPSPLRVHVRARGVHEGFCRAERDEPPVWRGTCTRFGGDSEARKRGVPTRTVDALARFLWEQGLDVSTAPWGPPGHLVVRDGGFNHTFFPHEVEALARALWGLGMMDAKGRPLRRAMDWGQAPGGRKGRKRDEEGTPAA